MLFRSSTFYIGTTSIAANRGSASQSLTGITSIDGYAATVSGAAQANITSVGTLTGLSVSGNANAGNFGTAGIIVSSIATGTAPFTVSSTTQVANLNVATSGTAGTVTTAAQPNITSLGTLSSVSVSGNANVGNLGTAGLITATGNVTAGNVTTAGQLVSTIATGTAPMVVSSTTKVANLNVEQVDGYDASIASSANTIVVRDANANIKIGRAHV